MGAKENVAVLRRLAAAYADQDLAVIDELLADDVVFHIPGCHPLAGTYTGKNEVFGYLGQVAATSEGANDGFEVHSVMGGDDHGAALVTGTIEHAGQTFVRPTVHLFHVAGGQVTEFWEASLDQHAEDKFWTEALGSAAP